jgi:hypothetical protein
LARAGEALARSAAPKSDLAPPRAGDFPRGGMDFCYRSATLTGNIPQHSTEFTSPLMALGP